MEPGTPCTLLLYVTEDGEAGLLGHGQYLGERIPPEEERPLVLRGLAVPTLQLDDGRLVYGYECWWGPEEHVHSAILAHCDSVEDCDIDQARAYARRRRRPTRPQGEPPTSLVPTE